MDPLANIAYMASQVAQQAQSALGSAQGNLASTAQNLNSNTGLVPTAASALPAPTPAAPTAMDQVTGLKNELITISATRIAWLVIGIMVGNGGSLKGALSSLMQVSGFGG